ncbi:hypothetical protein KQI84_01405 [bacterium]|nr:hypothetical protein [bacterium]
MTTAAFAIWENRIAPVFDTARQLHIVQMSSGDVVAESQEALREEVPLQRANRLLGLGIETLVCGAISRTLFQVIQSAGVQVIAFIAGDLPDVVEAWQEGRLEEERFAMPGCCGKPQRRRLGGGEEEPGRGRRGYWNRQCGDGGTAETICVCTHCGHTELHQRGVPHSGRMCPECGMPMTRIAGVLIDEL